MTWTWQNRALSLFDRNPESPGYFKQASIGMERRVLSNLTWPHPDSTVFWVFPSDEQIWNEAQNWNVYSQFCHLPSTPQNSQLPNSGLNLALLHFLQKIKCVPENNNKRAHSALAQRLLPHLSLSPPLFTLSFKLGFSTGPKPSARNCSSHLHSPSLYHWA